MAPSERQAGDKLLFGPAPITNLDLHEAVSQVADHVRIAITVDFSPWSPYFGGAQKSAHQLAAALARRDHEVTVFYTKGLADHIDVPPDLPYAIRWVLLLTLRTKQRVRLRPLTYLTMRPAVQRWLNERPNEPAVVHSQGDEAAAFGRLRHSSALAKVATLRHPIFADARRADTWVGQMMAWVRTPKYGLQRRAAHQADLCAQASRDAAQRIEEYYEVPPDRLKVVPNGIDEVFFAEPRPNTYRGDTAMFWGRLDESKGVDTLLEAWAQLGHDAPRLLIFGHGELERYQSMAARRGLTADKVEFRGWTSASALAQTIRTAALAVVPSRHESFGNSVAEAMASGIPVVATRVGSIPELVEHGESGWLIEAGDADALADAVRMLMADAALRQRLAQNGHTQASERFRWDHTAIQFEQLYAQLLRS